jgi:ubiquinone/menaquinone biosynthesis C-methylase UbiE
MLGNFSNPQKNIEAFGVRPGMKIAEVGPGSGHYTFTLAEKVGPEGKIYALEVQKELAEKLHQDAKDKGFSNVESVWANAENVGGTHLAKESIDMVVVANVLFQIPSKTTFAQECHRILKQDGVLAVIDWSESFGGLGPHSGYVVTKEDAQRLFEGYGFVFAKEINAGDHHWGILFTKAVV